MDFVSQKIAMATHVQGTAVREAHQESIHHEDDITLSSHQSQEGVLSQKEHMATGIQGTAGPEAHQESIHHEEDITLSSHQNHEGGVSHKGAMVANVEGTAAPEAHQEGVYHEEDSTLSSYQNQSERVQEEATPKGKQIDVDEQRGIDKEKVNIQKLVQLSDKQSIFLPATLKADEDQALDAQYRGRRHEVEQSASRRSSRSGSSCSPLGKEIEVEGSQQKEETGPKQNHGQELP